MRKIHFFLFIIIMLASLIFYLIRLSRMNQNKILFMSMLIENSQNIAVKENEVQGNYPNPPSFDAGLAEYDSGEIAMESPNDMLGWNIFERSLLFPEEALFFQKGESSNIKIMCLEQFPFIPKERLNPPQLKEPVYHKVKKSEKILSEYSFEYWDDMDALEIDFPDSRDSHIKVVRDNEKIMFLISWKDMKARNPKLENQVVLRFFEENTLSKMLAGESVFFDLWKIKYMATEENISIIRHHCKALPDHSQERGISPYILIKGNNMGFSEDLKDYVNIQGSSVYSRLIQQFTGNNIWLSPDFAISTEEEKIYQTDKGDLKARILFNDANIMPTSTVSGKWDILIIKALDTNTEGDITFEENKNIGLILGDFSRDHHGLSSGIILQL